MLRQNPRLLTLAVLATSFPSFQGASDGQQAAAPTRYATVCQLSNAPDSWNHVRVRVTALVTHGFENFSVSDPGCKPNPGSIWLTYGGRASSETIYCCPGEPESSRTAPLVVEGVTLPLADDKTFRQFRELLRKHARVTARATLVGTFFAGAKPGPAIASGGFGHLGCCTLLVIEAIERFDEAKAPKSLRRQPMSRLTWATTRKK